MSTRKSPNPRQIHFPSSPWQAQQLPLAQTNKRKNIHLLSVHAFGIVHSFILGDRPISLSYFLFHVSFILYSLKAISAAQNYVVVRCK